MMRAAAKFGKKMMRLPENEFQEISFAELRSRFLGVLSKIPDRAWKNNHSVVQLYRNDRMILDKKMDKIMIRRNDAEPIREWHALQNIKDKIVGEDRMAIQVFPRKDELVDVANMYWLFTETGKL
jgi:hypothetical protein